MRRAVLLLASVLITLLPASAVALAATVTFAPAVDYAVDDQPGGVTNGDFNNDDKLDVASANLDGGVSVL